MRWSFWALLALLSACGGGGGDVAIQPAPPVVATYSISGSVTTFVGAGLPGVSVQLSGARSATETTNASGGFQFANVPEGVYTVVPNAAPGPFNPIGTPVTVSGQSVFGLTFVKGPPPASMQEIAAYFAAAHTSAITAFNSEETALGNLLAAQGGFYSGRHYTLSRTNWVNAVSAFTGNAISYLQRTARTATIDRTAVAALLNAYAAQDSNLAATYYRGANWGLTGAALDSFVADTIAQTNAVYAASVAQIP